MRKIDICENILLNILALDKGFEEYEFYHCFLGEKELLKQAEEIPFDNAYSFLKNTLKNINRLEIEDKFPYYRKTYIKDLLKSVLAQADYFVYKKRIPFIRLEKELTAAPVLPPFDIEKEFAACSQKVKALAGMSIKQLRSLKEERISGMARIEKYVLALLDESKKKLKKYSSLFPQFDLGRILDKMEISVVQDAPNNSPCFFKYSGNYSGTAGLKYTKNVSKRFLRGFFAHEGLPGHFLYYCIKQYLADKKTADAVTLLDTFYSPENCLNEGLAVCSDIIFTGITPAADKASSETEKLAHKIFYNLWHSANIKKKNTALEKRLLRHIYPARAPEELLRYFITEEKYYTPFYPYGIYYAERFIPKIKKENLGFLYQQHSISTLKKLVKENK